MRILEVADRPGWAIDRLSKPLALIYPDEVTMSYFNTRPDRFLASGYSKLEGNTQYSTELGNQFDVEREEDLNQDFSDFDVLIAPTKHNLDILSQKHQKVVYIPFGIDLNRFKYLVRNRSERNVGFVGRIAKHKRFEVILKQCMDMGFKLIGCGYIGTAEYYLKYSTQADAKGLITWTDFLPEQSMQEFYNKMFVYICLSEPLIETGPLPVLEAMACGVPIISTEVGWLQDWGEDRINYIKVGEN